ncbi:MAG: gliding motility lipoprotein GldD [Bacteroidia bacterium]|nr:gliding motility lipoprotein GldD [Bacteroidia bacterium]
MNIYKKISCILGLGLLILSFTACEDEDDKVYSPRPRGYFRIDFPEKKYRTFDSLCPYKFEIPNYSHIVEDKHKGAEPCWLNLEFPKLRATVYLSYKPVQNDLAKHLENSHYFANKHQAKATGLDEIVIMRDSAKVYGLMFEISGNAASSVQFYLTDSTKHFLRGSLYFNAVPNSDSLQVVIDFLKKDILHLINTTSWKP